MMAARAGLQGSVSPTDLTALGARMDKNFDELKDMLRAYEERLRGLETREASCSPLMQSRMGAAWLRIDKHELEIAGLRSSVEALVLTAKKQESVIKWAAGMLAAVLASGAVSLLGRLIYLALVQ